MGVDGFYGVLRHLQQTMEFAVVAAAPIEEFRRWALERRWYGLRLLSSAGTSFKHDLHFEDSDGGQLPGLSVFTKNEDGTLRHFYSVSAVMGEKEYRGIDLLTPIWNLLDLTPAGRGKWMPPLEYN